MFCLSCKYIPQSTIIDCVKSIVRYHPDQKILVADSKSDDLSYLLKIREYDNVEIFVENKNRSIGSLWESYRRYPNEPFYILLQDTVVLKESLNQYINSPSLFTSFIYFIETVGQGCLSFTNNEDYNFYKKILENTEYQYPNLNQVIFGSFGPLFVIKNELMKRFESKGLIKNLQTSGKMEHQYAERIIGICAEQEGYSPSTNNIQGEYYNNLYDMLNNNMKFFNKIFLMSNGLRN